MRFALVQGYAPGFAKGYAEARGMTNRVVIPSWLPRRSAQWRGGFAAPSHPWFPSPD